MIPAIPQATATPIVFFAPLWKDSTITAGERVVFFFEIKEITRQSTIPMKTALLIYLEPKPSQMIRVAAVGIAG